MLQTFEMTFLRALAEDERTPTAEEYATALRAQEILRQVDEVVVLLGGKAGRLGECVVDTALLSGILQALKYVGKSGTPVTAVVDEGVCGLFDEQLYQERYWPGIVVRASQHAGDIRAASHLNMPDEDRARKRLLILDCHGANDGMPYLQVSLPDETLCGDNEPVEQVTVLGRLFRVGVRSYARRGPERRYADFVEALFALPRGSIEGQQAQPQLLLSRKDEERYQMLANACGLDPAAVQVICFWQSVVPAKCYELWDEVLLLVCQYFAQHFVGQKLDFLVACGPDQDLPLGIRKADMVEWLQDFSGVNGNARVLVRTIADLRDVAILSRHSLLALSNDTGPGHIAGAVGIPTITVFLPGNIYSKQVWASTMSHAGVTLEPNPFSYQQIEAAVLWGKTDIIDSIPPRAVADEVIRQLPDSFRVS